MKGDVRLTVEGRDSVALEVGSVRIQPSTAWGLARIWIGDSFVECTAGRLERTLAALFTEIKNDRPDG